MAEVVHDVVGWRFKGPFGVVVRCTRYLPERGFFMKVIANASDAYRRMGEEFDVSERAIGRTFHRIDGDAAPAIHERPCRCSVCKEKS